MFNLARTKAHFKADLREIKKFFRREKNTAPVIIEKKIDPNKFTVERPRRGVAFGTFSRVKKIQGRTDFSASAEHHRARVAGREETREQLRHKRAA